MDRQFSFQIEPFSFVFACVKRHTGVQKYILCRSRWLYDRHKGVVRLMASRVVGAKPAPFIIQNTSKIRSTGDVGKKMFGMDE